LLGTQAAAAHPLCVRLHGAFQDTHSLYLLQEFVPGKQRDIILILPQLLTAAVAQPMPAAAAILCLDR
jgi:hypothetical protein